MHVRLFFNLLYSKRSSVREASLSTFKCVQVGYPVIVLIVRSSIKFESRHRVIESERANSVVQHLPLLSTTACVAHVWRCFNFSLYAAHAK